MTDITLAHRICEHLDKYVYDRIWNQPYSEYRTHIVPILLNSLKQVQKAVTDEQGHASYVYEEVYETISGSLRGRYSQIQLPVEADYRKNKQFYVYSVPRSYFRSIELDVRSWTLLSDFCNSGLTEFHMFTTLGEMLWRGGIYLRQADKNDCILLAVDAAMFDKCTSSNGKDPSRVMLCKYHDSDSVQDNLTYCTKIVTKKTSPVLEKDETMTFYAGRLVKNPKNQLARFAVGGYVESCRDLDVLGKLEIPVTSDSAPVYTYSDGADSPDRLLVHIPKTMNTKNLIITPNTCEIFVFPKTLDSGVPDMRGFYLYTAGRGEHFHQITHNDFSIDLDWLKGVAAEHGFADFYLHVLVKTHNDSRTVVRDTNYIDLLYSHNDDEIIKFLTWDLTWLMEPDHMIRHTMYFWNAKILEDSLYADALIRRRRHRPRPDYARDADGTVVEPILFPRQCDVCGFRNRNICSEHVDHDVCSLRLTREYLMNNAWFGSGSYQMKHDSDDHDEALTEMVCPYFSYRGIEEFVDILGYYHVLSLIAKRVTHLELTANNARNFTVGVPLALSDLTTDDFFPVVYHNGVRIPQEFISTKKTDSSMSEFTREVTINGLINEGRAVDALSPEPVPTEIIQSVYCQHIRIMISDDYTIPFNKGDKVVVELFDHVSDNLFDEEHPRIKLYTKPEFNHILTDDIQFRTAKRYFVKVNHEYREIVETTEEQYWATPESERKFKFYPGQIITGDQHYEAEYSNDWEQTVRSTKVKLYVCTKEGSGADTTISYKALDMSTVVIDKSLMNIRIPAALLKTAGVLNSSGAVVEPKKEILFVEGPTTKETTTTFDITEDTFGTLGRYPRDAVTFDQDYTKDWYLTKFPYDTTVVFLNRERLVRDLDYYAIGYESGSYDQVLISKYRRENYFKNCAINMQNVSYLGMTGNRLDLIRSDVTTIKNFHGFLTGNVINWGGEDPFWFDGLSTLVVDGKVCSNFKYSLGAIRITDNDDHRNGAPYEIWTAASSQAIELLGDWHRVEDERKLRLLQDYFMHASQAPIHTTIVPHSHKIYSTYLEKIIADIINERAGDIKDAGEWTDAQLIAKFNTATYNNVKATDVVYNHIDSGHASDLMFVDVYPIYHRLRARDRATYTMIARIVQLLKPEDDIQHRDANNNVIQHKKEESNG